MNQVAAPASLTIWEQLLLGVSRQRAHRLLPGIGLALAVMLSAEQLSSVLGRLALRLQGIDPTGRPSGISAITCAILLGLAVANSVGVHKTFSPGLDFCVKKLLRLGIILVGIRLSFLDVLRFGLWGVPVVAVVIAVALLVTTWLARRLGLSETLGALAAASTAICGVTAAVAIAPTIDADETEVAYTVANVTIFGMLAMFVYPYLAHFLFGLQSGASGLFLGTAIHDTSQVMGAAMAYKDVFGDELALKVATVTKLTRNVFLVAVVPLLAFYFARKRGSAGGKIRIGKLFPLFVLGFLVAAVLRSIGDAGIQHGSQLAFGVWHQPTWTKITKLLGETAASAALGSAMAAVGLSTNLKALRGLGLKPLYVGGASALLVGGLGLGLAALVGPRIFPGLPSAAAATRLNKPALAVGGIKPAQVTPPTPTTPPEPLAQPTFPTDPDGDGIVGAADACPSAGGPDNADPAKHGCPRARVENGQIRMLEPLRFTRYGVKVLGENKPTLNAIRELLKDHPKLKVSVDAYTNIQPKERQNLILSQRRAAAIAKWLARHDVPRARVKFRGFGANPAPDTNEAAADGNRIEITILGPDDSNQARRTP